MSHPTDAFRPRQPHTRLAHQPELLHEPRGLTTMPSAAPAAVSSLSALWRVIIASLLLVAAPAVAVAQVEFRLATTRTEVRPGEQVVVAAILEHEDGWHVHTNDPVIPPEMEGFIAVPTVFTLTPPPSAPGIVTIGPAQWPIAKPYLVDFLGTGEPVNYAVFGGTAITYIPVIISNDAPLGPLTLTLTGGYQACDDRTCLRPVTLNETITFTVVAPTATLAPAAPDPMVFAGFDASVFARMLAGEVAGPADQDFNFFGLSFAVGSTGFVNGAIIVALALLGGFLLNLTPCVLPVIPIKIMSLSAAAGNPRRALLLGGVMSLGVVAFFIAIGAAIATLSSFRAINQLFQHPEFSLGVGLFIAIMGVGMVGLFSVKLPNAVYAMDPNRESIPGSFLFGVLTAILSTPCTAPFMGSAAAWAAKQPPALTMLTFAAIGLGMALPYLVLAAFPRLVRKVPRTGPASSLVKQVMGLLLFAVAIFFIGTGLDGLLREPVDPPFREYWWAIVAVTVGASIWMIARTFKITRAASTRGVIVAIGLLLSVSIVLAARGLTAKGPIEWTYYTTERFDEAVARGDVVVVDFTAEWCFNCKALEQAVLFRDEVASRLNSEGVTAMKIDLTGDNPVGQAKLESLNWVGIPLLAIYGPGLPEPLLYDSYTPETVLSAIERARGK